MAIIFKRRTKSSVPAVSGPEYAYGDTVRMSPSVTSHPEPFEYISDPITAPRPTFGPWADHSSNCKCNVCR